MLDDTRHQCFVLLFRISLVQDAMGNVSVESDAPEYISAPIHAKAGIVRVSRDSQLTESDIVS